MRRLRLPAGQASRAFADFTPAERRIITAHRTPRQVQRWLRGVPYNHEIGYDSLRTFRGVVRHRSAHCLEAVLAAATVLEQHGHPPVVLDLCSEDELDHVILLFRKDGAYGAVARSRDWGLHGRAPIYATIPELVDSYVDPYVDGEGRIVGYGVAHLDEIVRGDWRLSERNVWEVEQKLIRMPHKRWRVSQRRHDDMLRRFREFKARFANPTPADWRRLHGPQTAGWW